ncbi:hypothetical protein CALCODRAFT_93708 [Calocera cornea HHB12733]|uniref:Uncharacterized protein n=1 Tax=Calocera cornea HHB12733 TaxID=1353952 RepID=A0A165D8I5_9BASI|nr:hypothetical protein CALCODRAFT_93708 [Calocera cornea HHB12733]
MWELMMKSWDPDRTKRPQLTNILDALQYAVLNNALTCNDVDYIRTFDANDIIDWLSTGEYPDDTAPVTLMRCLDIMMMSDLVFERLHYTILVQTVANFLVPSENANSPCNSAVFICHGAFHLLARMAKHATEQYLCFMRSAFIDARITPAFVLQGARHIEFEQFSDYQVILPLAMPDPTVYSHDSEDDTLGAALRHISRHIQGGTPSKTISHQWKEFLSYPIVQARLIVGMHGGLHPETVDWMQNIFSVILQWLDEMNGSDFLPILEQIVDNVEFTVFAEHTALEVPLEAVLQVAAIMFEVFVDRRSMCEANVGAILGLLYHHLEQTPDYDNPRGSLRLLKADRFSAELLRLMYSPSRLKTSAFVFFVGILKASIRRLSYDPADEVFGLLESLPWLDVVSSPLPPTRLPLQLDILNSLLTCRCLARGHMEDSESDTSMAAHLLSEAESSKVMAMLARCLTSTLDRSCVPVVVELLKNEAFRPIFRKAFSNHDSAPVSEAVFSAAYRIWVWTYTVQFQTTSLLQTELSETISSGVPLEAQVVHIRSSQSGALQSGRVPPLLRLLSLRINASWEHNTILALAPLLLECITENMCCKWVASQQPHGVPDLIGNWNILRAAFSTLHMKDGPIAMTQIFAMEVIVAAYRRCRGLDKGLRRAMEDSDWSDIPGLCVGIQTVKNHSLAPFWEWLLYRTQQRIDETDEVSSSLKTLVSSALSQIRDDDDVQAGYAALLVVQAIFVSFTNGPVLVLTALPFESRDGLRAWLTAHQDEAKDMLDQLPLSHSPGAPIQVNTALLEEVRHLVQSPVSPSFRQRSPLASTSASVKWPQTMAQGHWNRSTLTP